MKVYLKVKIKSLAAEAHIIRKEARKVSGDLRHSLNEHRKFDVRREARAALLAYGFLRGLDYSRMEGKVDRPPYWSRIEQLVKKYGEGDIRDRMQRFSEWKEAATEKKAA
ncbi:hypothetical protein ASD54_12350 [Rhizobium sp. Root149]|uniref:hypothetical protein n=1 Tax=Rhizobium sp. Root149 TaxID=1736473 RepID=UPI000714B3CF|nr:hypothetical protein [Rhizobium sp. Root149]KQZ49723.1 hypothetical protein ASD54_12350 [Rhizobium sp. Root149]